MRKRLFVIPLVLLFWGTLATAQENAPAKPKEAAEASSSKIPDKAELFKKFTESMSGVKLVGQFTVIGKENGPLSKEEYTIVSVSKVEEGDKWLLKARIKYGQHDVTVPLLLDILWAGDTPVITLTNFTIPGLGTFGSRVLIYDGSYAGTWSHGKVGGHIFGTIEKLKPEDAAVQPAPEKSVK